jgi:hypothetical protein
MAYGVNKGKSQVEALKNWETGLRDIAAKASDLGGIQGGVDAVEGFYANAPAQLQQQQNQGLFALRQQAGDAAGMLAGRGGASNAMSSSAASAQSAAMASGVGQFMGDIAAQRSNLAFQGAQSQLQNAQLMQDYNLAAAETQNTVNAALIEQDYFDKLEGANQLALTEEMDGLLRAQELTGKLDTQKYIQSVQQYAAQLPPEAKVVVYKAAIAALAKKGINIGIEWFSNTPTSV